LLVKKQLKINGNGLAVGAGILRWSRVPDWYYYL